MKQWKYRFKTEEEFVKEHGLAWRYVVGFNPYGDMDYLCGTVLEYDFLDDEYMIRISRLKSPRTRRRWQIYREMLTKNEPLVPNYKPRKIRREI